MSNAKNNVIVITDEEGKQKTIRPKSARIAEFLEKYPPDSYRLVVDVCDDLSQRKGLLELYKIPLSQGKKPEEVGLPPISTVSDIVFTARLFNREGLEIRNNSAQGKITQYKDRERFETAAILRILDSVGCGSDLDSDPEQDLDEELADLQAQGLKTEVVPAHQPVTQPASSSEEAPESGSARPLHVVSESNAATPRDGRPSKEATLLSLRRMIKEQAARYQIPEKDIPGITDKSLATRLLKGLMQAKSPEAARKAIEVAKAA